MNTSPLKKLTLLGVLLLAAIGAAACSPVAAPTTQPTPDLNMFRTEVAATVIAQIPQILAQTPSATPQPSATLQPTATETPAPVTETPAVTLTVGTPGDGTPTGDLAKWVSQSIQDGEMFTPGETFTMVWRLQNVGVTTWTDGFRLRHFSGDRFGAPSEIPLDRDVPPSETIDITIQMKAPNNVGDYSSVWVMSNEDLYNFKEPVYLEIEVAIPPTATLTATIQPTPTATRRP